MRDDLNLDWRQEIASDRERAKNMVARTLAVHTRGSFYDKRDLQCLQWIDP